MLLSILIPVYNERAVAEKNRQFFMRWRAVNGEYIYGRRKEPFGVANFPGEMEQLERQVDHGGAWFSAALIAETFPGNGVTANGIANMVCEIHTCANEPPRCRFGKTGTLPMCKPVLYSRSSGTSDICSGTTCSAKTTKKMTSLPLNLIQARP